MEERSEQPDRIDPPLKMIHCTKSVNVGGGIARMDSYYHRYLDPRLIDITFMVLDREKPGGNPYDPSIRYRYTGMDNRFETLLACFADADIVQFSDGFNPMVCEAARAAGVPALVEINHDIVSGQLYDRIDVTICVSGAVRAVQPRPERAVTILNGIELDAFPFRAEPRRDERIVILQVGARDKASFNLDDIADRLLSIDPRVELWLAGDGQERKNAERITFFGVRRDIDKIYRQADILFVFTKKEAFGLAVIEAMASGALPVVSNDGGPARIVTHGRTGWIGEANDPGAAVAVVKEAIAHIGSNRWETMRRAARRAVEEGYSITGTIREYEKVYRGLLKRKGRRTVRGPANAVRPPEADIDDAVYHMNAGRRDKTEEAIGRMIARNEPIRIPLCAWSAEKLAKYAAVYGRADLAAGAYRKLYQSGFRDVSWMKDWLDMFPGGESAEFLIAELLDMEPDNPDTIMRAAQFYLNAGHAGRGLNVLEEGMRRAPRSDELKDVYDLLKSKLGG